MAYISQTYKKGSWSGPFPHLKGEFCGNEKTVNLELTTAGVVHRRFVVSGNGEKGWKVTSYDMRAGKPAPSRQRTSEELARNGIVGLYFVHDTMMHMNGTTRVVATDVLIEEVVTGTRRAAKPFKPDVPMQQKQS